MTNSFWKNWPLTREGWFWLILSLGILATGLFKNINLITLLSCFLITMICWNLWKARRQIPHLKAERELPEFIFAGTPFAWFLRVQTTGKHLAEGITFYDEVGKKGWFVPKIHTQQIIPLEGESVFSQRGVLAWDQIQTKSGHPFGLVEVSRPISSPQESIVFPQLGILNRPLLRRYIDVHSPTQGAIRSIAHRNPMAQQEFHGLRNYRPGDSPRLIHWRTSARRGELMVREFEDLPNDHLFLVLDTFIDPATSPIIFERAVSLAATIVWEWCRQKGDRLALGIVGPTSPFLQGTSGLNLAWDMLRELAILKKSKEEKNTLPNMDWPWTEMPQSAVLVITTRESDLGQQFYQQLHRPVAMVHLGRNEDRDFFEELG